MRKKELKTPEELLFGLLAYVTGIALTGIGPPALAEISSHGVAVEKFDGPKFRIRIEKGDKLLILQSQSYDTKDATFIFAANNLRLKVEIMFTPENGVKKARVTRIDGNTFVASCVADEIPQAARILKWLHNFTSTSTDYSAPWQSALQLTSLLQQHPHVTQVFAAAH